MILSAADLQHNGHLSWECGLVGVSERDGVSVKIQCTSRAVAEEAESLSVDSALPVEAKVRCCFTRENGTHNASVACGVAKLVCCQHGVAVHSKGTVHKSTEHESEYEHHVSSLVTTFVL